MFKQKHSEYSKWKISKSCKGRIMTEEHRRKISESCKGLKKKPRSEEHKKHISEALKNKYKNGYKVSYCQEILNDPDIQELIKANKEAGLPWNKGLKGLKMSEETKKKMRRSKEPTSYDIQKIKEAHFREIQQQKEIAEINKHRLLTEEEWEMPIMTIAENRQISVEDVNEIFYRMIKKKENSEAVVFV